MKIGDIKGLGKVYDENGEVILKFNEKVEKKFEAKCRGGAFRKRRKRFYEINFLKGRGKFTVTEQRIVFIREPLSYVQIIGQFSPLGIAGKGGAIDWATKARRVREWGGKEFFEIPFDEITMLRVNIIGTYIECTTVAGKYNMTASPIVGTILRETLLKNGYKINKKGFVEPPLGYVPKKKEESQDVQRRKRKSFKERLSEMTLKDILLWVLQVLIVIFMIGFFILITQ